MKRGAHVKPDSKKFSTKLTFSVPNQIPSLVNRAAELKCQTPAEYMRRAVVANLEADGLFAPEAI
jgi:hypothetical protein